MPSAIRPSGFTGALAALSLSLGAVGVAIAQTQPQTEFHDQPPASEAAPAPAAAAPAVPSRPAIAAKVLFGSVKGPAPTAPQAIGDYAKGCLAGGKSLPVDGRAWQVMRLKRNRNWGHPVLIDFLERFAEDAQAYDGWPGLLVGDLAQPRGGPMLTGHASHQVGLDADIWFTPMPSRRLTEQEREDISAVSMLAPSKLAVDPALWDDTRARIIKRAASAPEVERIFVHPAIKKALCQSTASQGPAERGWLAKVRPWWEHHYHFHVRIGCPKDSPGCHPQKPIPGDDGCGKELDDWMKMISAPPRPVPADQPPKPPPPPMTIEALPAECRNVLQTGVSRGIVKTEPMAATKWRTDEPAR